MTALAGACGILRRVCSTLTGATGFVGRRVVERHDNLAQPVSALRYRGELVVTEHGEGRVIALSDGAARVLAEGLEAPAGLATDGVSLFVGDRARGEILVFILKRYF